MKLLLKRKFKGEEYTIGDLFIDGEFFCNTLEDTVRDLPATCPNTPKWKDCECKEKIYSKTAIPAGTYKITMEYSPRFKRKLPLLHNVPHFLGILLHNGSKKEHSSGCVLVGNNSFKGGLSDSRATMERLIEIMSNVESINITIE